MQAECFESRLELNGITNRTLTVDFAGGEISSDGGVSTIAAVDRMYAVISQLAECFTDHRNPEDVEHTVVQLLRQRVYGICLGYEDLNDHDRLRLDQLLAAAVGKDDPTGNDRRTKCDKGKPLAGKSTLNRLELSKPAAGKDTPYCKIVADLEQIENLLIDIFLDAHEQPPQELILDIDPTDAQLHGEQTGRYFQAHYDGYCFLPLYVFCGPFLLAAKLRPGNVGAMAGALSTLKKIEAPIRERWPDVKVIVRGDSHFCDDTLMTSFESSEQSGFCVGMPSNPRLMAMVRDEQRQMAQAMAKRDSPNLDKACRTYKDLTYQTLTSWQRSRRVVAKIEHLPGEVGDTVSESKAKQADGKATELEQLADQAKQAAEQAKKDASIRMDRAKALEALAEQRTRDAGLSRDAASKAARNQAKRTGKVAKQAAGHANRAVRAAEKASATVDKCHDQARAARAEADWLKEQSEWVGKSNVRFVVTSESVEDCDAQSVYEAGYCPRGDMENRIKEQQLYLFADVLPCDRMRSNQIRLYLSSFAYVLDMLLREFGLRGTELENAQCHTIRERLFKIGGSIKVTTRRVWVRLSSSYPYRSIFQQVTLNLNEHWKRIKRRSKHHHPLEIKFSPG